MTRDERKELICEKLRQTKREGIEDTIHLLSAHGYFLAPASARHHLNCVGGLAAHSLNVYEAAMVIYKNMTRLDRFERPVMSEDSVTLVSLLHDVCKISLYKPRYQEDMNNWERPYILDFGEFPLGHGEKSVVMLMQFGLKLTNDEIMAIRWHMGAWDLPFQSYNQLGNYNKAKQICPLLTVLQCADELATSLMEETY